MDLATEQHRATYFCVDLQKSAAEVVQMMKEAYKVQVLGTSTIFQCHKEFSKGRESPCSTDFLWWQTSNRTSTKTNVNTVCYCCYPEGVAPVRTNTRRITAHYKNLYSLDTH